MKFGQGKRANALWGKSGGRGLAAALVACALAFPLAASADPGKGNGNGKGYVAPGLLADANAHADKKFSVIIQSRAGASDAERAVNGNGSLRKRLALVGAVAADLPGGRIQALSKDPNLVITPDSRVHLDGFYSTQLWPYVSGVSSLWGGIAAGPGAPTIAVVDSGVQGDRSDFGGRVRQFTMTTLPNNSPGDGFGHGTFVAGIAAGSSAGYAGAAPNANILSLDVMDDTGMARTSDVIAAAQWMVDNKAAYNIRVANFSLHSGTRSSFRYDPLDQAVEKLWFSGVVVVAAAGNYAVDGQPSGVLSAPGNDPFVITVGAADLHGTLWRADDTIAPWSSYGRTRDGFWKPELSAAGRYMVGPVPVGSGLALQRPDHVVAPGYMMLSGTSFSAPVVAGAAAELIARHPDWTPDQVKGALMVSAKALPLDPARAGGVGELNALRALLVTSPPNPNRALEKFLVSDPAGGSAPVFDAASWDLAVRANASWDLASYDDASYSDASWDLASYADASWDLASYADASYDDASYADASYDDASYADNANGDGVGSAALSPDDLAAAETGTLTAP